MKIQFNTDKNITGNEKMVAPLEAMLVEKLDRFSAQITRLEVHLADENANKEGDNDKRCIIEARLDGMKPIAVTNHANNNEDAVKGAIEKLKTLLDSTLGKLASKS